MELNERIAVNAGSGHIDPRGKAVGLRTPKVRLRKTNKINGQAVQLR